MASFLDETADCVCDGVGGTRNGWSEFNSSLRSALSFKFLVFLAADFHFIIFTIMLISFSATSAYCYV